VNIKNQRKLIVELEAMLRTATPGSEGEYNLRCQLTTALAQLDELYRLENNRTDKFVRTDLRRLFDE
jgi:hypothetical protein